MNTSSPNGNGIKRVDFSKIKTAVPIPNLIEVQKRSYERFLQMYQAPADREDVGLQAVFKGVFPISDFKETCSLEFVQYSIGNWECKCGQLEGIENLRTACGTCGRRWIVSTPKAVSVACPQCGAANASQVRFCDNCGDTAALKHKYDVAECQEREMNFAVPLKVKIRLVVYEKDAESGQKSIRDIKEQEVYFGDIPLLTENGTFIINGTERVIVSQLHRSPGVFFQATEDRSLFMSKVIPYRGSWVEFEFDSKNLLYVRIDRKRKFLGSIFMRALGMRSTEEILRAFYARETLRLDGKKLFWKVSEGLSGRRPKIDIVHPKTEEVIAKKGKRIRRSIIPLLEKAGIEEIPVEVEEIAGAVAIGDVVDLNTGEVVIEANQPVTEAAFDNLLERGISRVELCFPTDDEISEILCETLRKDTIRSPEEALVEIYRRLRPGDPPTVESSRSLFKGMFTDPRRYDFSRVGRLKLNTKLGVNAGLDERLLSTQDYVLILKYLFRLRKNIGAIDDIDHLGNRRVRSVGELLENQFRIGLIRMERAIKEKMSVYQEMTTAMPHDLINAKPVMAAVQEFFGSSQLSQFMDQTNPLSEVTHKRRLSALGAGGLSRERAGFEVRDVHPTHYGRICPIETPEGPNIGLISSLSCYARINEYGFIESPYRKVAGGKVVDYVRVLHPGDSPFQLGQEVENGALEEENRRLKKRKARLAAWEPSPFYLTAWQEDQVNIAQANAELGGEGELLQDRVIARSAGEARLLPREEVHYIDVSPKQLVSVAASLIPFLENDDANRALMGSNMQRQAVPLLRAEAPLVGTGMESVTARDSGAVVICRRDGLVDSLDSQRIIVRVGKEASEGADVPSEDFGADIYSLTKFKRSNQNTCINQKPVVRAGQRVRRGDVLADGPCTDRGELALGRNVLVAFMPWRGYNFEDAILVSEKLVREDYYTSIHIEEFEIEARDTKLGAEEITRDIPNVSEDFLKDLDDSGIVRIGAYARPGDILVGKVTPKGETQLTPEEKLLKAIFGEKSGDVRDASLTTPPGIEGTVVDVKIFCRKGVEKDARAMAIEEEQIRRMEKDLHDEIRILREENRTKITDLLEGETLVAPLKERRRNREILPKGTELTREVLGKLAIEDLVRVEVKGASRNRAIQEVNKIEERTERKIEILKKLHHEKIAQLKKGDELAPGVIKMVKVYVAMKRKMSVGDKMAGRHGNKGVIARVLPEEDMPYLPDGTPVEIVLNPLGVPSRMNVGQILETHLGWAARALGMHFATPVFDGARETDIKEMLRRAGLPESGKIRLVDGRSGDPFEQHVTVGFIYMMKLSHLVDDKIHARSIGPYSLITQQPLGGKAQFGGQRFGEMEVWALEAYGAAHTLQELLTAKSDDVYGRTKIYEALVKGETTVEPGLPESFNVLVRELQSLCLDVELIAPNK